MSDTETLGELRATVAALGARLRAVEDQVAISQLVARYGPAVDSGSAEAAAALWAEDGAFEVPPYAIWTGHDEIAGMVNGAGHQGLITNGCGHVLTAPLVKVDGDEARAWNYALNIRWDREADRFWVARVSANSWLLHRGADGWRVAHRTNRSLDGSPEPRALFQASTQPFEAGAGSA
ncbi:nuclear transport factor 2 family protein [Frankia sp. AgB1.9]|uniref:nuclear transport factor 2 family protein n=1 Tax=unclassified Frankia TaxID=2632575 RepID=UPI0019333FB4|nr:MULTISPECIES: nuclear transport factor 2 family protein [unclassified Frankia]MBL7490840.1 nuclear transport factor 2 family protein [Frankia sp. AgW1.1]MBL7551013.1 nuclear transport factor 2 family protein [Frankia sp. AgB1.9]MBL7621206.1 nuclear transport factor 2 family protein [Frankia sp. AgB1.8]